MSDYLDRAVQVIEGHVSTTLLATDIAQELDAAGLLATPAMTGDARASWMGRDFPVTPLEEEQP